MTSSNPIFKDGTVVLSVAEFENLIQCKKELIAIKEDLKTFRGDDL